MKVFVIFFLIVPFLGDQLDPKLAWVAHSVCVLSLNRFSFLLFNLHVMIISKEESYLRRDSPIICVSRICGPSSQRPMTEWPVDHHYIARFCVWARIPMHSSLAFFKWNEPHLATSPQFKVNFAKRKCVVAVCHFSGLSLDWNHKNFIAFRWSNDRFRQNSYFCGPVCQGQETHWQGQVVPSSPNRFFCNLSLTKTSALNFLLKFFWFLTRSDEPLYN